MRMSREERDKYSKPTAVLPLTNIKAKYRTFLSVPASVRPDEMKTIKQFAAHFRIQASLLRQWEQEPNFWNDVFGEAQSVLGRALADVMEALVRRAKNGNVNAIKLALEVLGVHHDKLEVQQTKANDQIIMILPPGMEIPQLPNYQDSQALESGEGALTQTHIDDDMDYVIDTPEQTQAYDEEDMQNVRFPAGMRGERLGMYHVASRPRNVDDPE
jgi:hypothetical protein